MIFDMPFVARSIENPAVPLGSYDADSWPFGYGGSSSGIAITKDRALTFPAFWRGINLVSRDLAKLPLFVYRRAGEGKERDQRHPAYRLLRYRPNAEMTAFVFRQTLQAHAMCQGNGYAYIVRAGDATPLDLLPLVPDKTWPVRENGRLLYVTDIDGEQRKLLPENVLHIKGLGYDGLVGYNVIQYAADALGLGLAAQQYGSRFFKNNARPSVAIEVPNAMNPEAAQKMVDNWNKIHAGIENSHRVALLTNGAKVNTYSTNARESQLQELREFQIRDIANIIGVPPHRLGDTTRTSHSSLEQENQSYLDDALDGWLCNWEAELADKLLTEDEKESDSHVIEFMRQALVRADLPARGEYYAKALAGRPWMTQDQVRNLENMNPMGGDAAELLDPPNITKGLVDKPDADKPLAKDDDDDRAERSKLIESVRQVVRHATGRMVKRVGDDARRVAKKPREFPDWLDKLAERHRSIIAAELSEAFGPACILIRRAVDAAAETDAILSEVRKRLDGAMDQFTDDTFAAGVDAAMVELESSIPQRVADELFNENQERRAA